MQQQNTHRKSYDTVSESFQTYKSAWSKFLAEDKTQDAIAIWGKNPNSEKWINQPPQFSSLNGTMLSRRTSVCKSGAD